jgi:ribulose-phosphate 3-epimerase
MGYTPQRLVGETASGETPNLLAVCRRIISSPLALVETEEALRQFPQLLTLEDFVSSWGGEWGFGEDMVHLAQEGAAYYDGVVGFRRFAPAEEATVPGPQTPRTAGLVKLAPSILSADVARLGTQVAEAAQAGADYIHVDVMDGHFVPNMTFGPLVVEALRACTALPLDVHLMVQAPEQFVGAFAKAGATILTVHVEACPHLHRVVQQIKDAGARAGVALNPATSLSAVEEVLPELDLVLLMTVNPGFPGQTFIEAVLPKVARLRRLLDERGLGAELEVDGGINAATAPRVVAAGARVLVAGSAVFNDRESVAAALDHIRSGLVPAQSVPG